MKSVANLNHVSSVSLTMTYSIQNSILTIPASFRRNKILGMADYGFTAIFTMECTLKILDLGFVLHPGSYLRSVVCC